MVQTVDDITRALPGRFRRGQGLLGPEFYGCFGTGRRPCILRSPYREAPTFYLVGGEIDVDEQKFPAACDRLAGRRRNVYGKGKARVYVYADRRGAVRRFLMLCQGVMGWNADQARQHKAALEGARRGDVGSALALNDW